MVFRVPQNPDPYTYNQPRSFRKYILFQHFFLWDWTLLTLPKYMINQKAYADGFSVEKNAPTGSASKSANTTGLMDIAFAPYNLSAQAQQHAPPKQGTYLTYQNTTNGISIQYPSDWIINQTQNSNAVKLHLGIDNQPKTLDLKQYLQEILQGFLQERFSSLRLLQSTTNYTLAGRPAYELQERLKSRLGH
jgi:hypothetical protein